nr:4-hydroxyphenylpyruvate dioxygenase [Herpetosiphonaceae bacterium]
AVKRGARPVMEPATLEGEAGTLIKATIGTYGDTTHSLIQRSNGDRVAFPHFQTIKNPPLVIDGGYSLIDHVAISLEPGKLVEWVDFYINVLGFHQSHEENIVTEYSGMNSRVVQNKTGTIKFPMQEPIQGKRRSQVEEFLTFHHGAGAQHLALLSSDIIQSIKTLRTNGIEFVRTPDTYYETLQERVGIIDEDSEMLRELNILVDRDSSGYLLQIFTKPLQSRPTLFFEIIQRKNAQGFGSGNIKALFAAVEREQALRGNL